MPQPIILPDTSGIAQGISGAGSAFANAINQISQQRRQQEYGSILDKVMSSIDRGSSPMDVTRALSSALKQGVPPNLIKDYGSMFAILQKAQQGMPAGPEKIKEMSNLFQKFGMPEDVALRNAELWGKLTTGGQTEMAKLLVDQIARSQYSQNPYQASQQQQNGMEQQGVPQVIPEQSIQQIDQMSQSQSQIQNQEKPEVERFPKLDTFENLTPKEKVSKSANLRKENLPHYSKAIDQIKEVGDERFRIQELTKLNQKGTLPTGFGKYNVNYKTGELMFPGLANADTQRYVKLINDFTVKAKNTFGSRVTNFELQKFLQRLPNLAGTPEGRSAILRQMQIIGDLNESYYSTLADTYEHYKLGNIEQEDANRISRGIIKEKEQKLIDEYRQNEFRLDQLEQEALDQQKRVGGMKSVGFYKTLPKKAKEGSTAMNKETNRTYKFIGGKWRLQ